MADHSTTAAPRVGSEVGCLAPDFALKDAADQMWRLSDYRGKAVALIFYPKDETPVCTKQMCSIRDRWQDYEATGAEVVAVSVGSVSSHKSFTEHHRLSQRLLADEQGQVTKLYKVQSFFGGSQRAVIIIDADGIIRHRSSVFPLFRPSDDEVIGQIRRIAGSA